MKRRTMFWLAGGVLVLLGFLVVDYLVAEWVSDGVGAESARSLEEFRATAKRHHVAFLNDARLTASWLPPKRREKNAGPWLKQIVPWSNEEPGDAKLLTISKEDEKRFDHPWTETEPALFAAEFEKLAWFEKLREFDHWHFVEPTQLISEAKLRNRPLPRMVDLVFWTKVRLLKGKVGDFERAAAEVRHLTSILLSTENIVGIAVARRLLIVEREAVMAFRKQGIAGADAVVPVSKAKTDALRRVNRAALAYLDPSLSQDSWLRTRTALKGTPIFCQSLVEAAYRGMYLKALLQNYQSFGAGFERLRQASLQNDDCYHDVARAMWRFAPKDVETSVKRIESDGEIIGPNPVERSVRERTSPEKLHVAWALALYVESLPNIERYYGPAAAQ